MGGESLTQGLNTNTLSALNSFPISQVKNKEKKREKPIQDHHILELTAELPGYTGDLHYKYDQ